MLGMLHLPPTYTFALALRLRRTEAREENSTAKEQLKSSRWLFRKNPENLSQKEQARLEELDLKHLATGVAYQMRLVRKPMPVAR